MSYREKDIRNFLKESDNLNNYKNDIYSKFPEINGNCCFYSDKNDYSLRIQIKLDDKTSTYSILNFSFDFINIIFWDNIDNQKIYKDYEIIVSGEGEYHFNDINSIKNKIKLNNVNYKKIFPYMNYSIFELSKLLIPNNNNEIKINGTDVSLHKYTGPELELIDKHCKEYFKKHPKIEVYKFPDRNEYFIDNRDAMIGWDLCNNISFEVSNFGRARIVNEKGEIIDEEKMKLIYNENGYLKTGYTINISNDYFVIIHRLVAETFPNRLETDPILDFEIFKYVHHIDGNCFNNFADNLLWVTPYQHALIHPNLRYTLQ
jgi:hypothetical protein